MAHGIDVSLFDGRVDWDRVRAARITFAIVKASQRLFDDPQFQRNQIEARRTMRRVGYYHFLNLGPGEPDPVAQARHFVATVGPLRRGEFMVMDFEKRGLPRALVLAGWRAFLGELERLTGRVPFIYTSRSLTESYGIGSEFARYPLWLVSSIVLSPTPMMPRGWPTLAIWQFTSKGQVPGVPSNADLDFAPDSFLDVAPARRDLVVLGLGLTALAGATVAVLVARRRPTALT